MREYVDFLGSQAPYDQLDASDLEALAQLVEVEYFTTGTIIITAGEPPLSHFYVVRSGEVEVVDRGRVIDVLGAGETFGQISVLSGLAPPLSIRAADDTLCYRFCDPRPHLRHPERLQFSHYGSLVTRERLTRAGLVDQALRLARHQMRPIVWCAPDVTVSAAASAMTDAGQSCALIQRGDQFGIVTDSDFRAGLATGTLTTTSAAAQCFVCRSLPAAALPASSDVPRSRRSRSRTSTAESGG
jgi:CBS domain-containing protein